MQGKNTITFSDVLVGEVWIASGQSNMTLSVKDALNGRAEAATSEDPQLRMFTVPRQGSLEPQSDVKAAWESANPDHVSSWTAVGYFYARQLRRELNVPVGIIHSSFGGTPAEAWTSRSALESDPEFKNAVDEQIAVMRRYPEDQNAYPQLLQAWITSNGAQDSDAPAAPPEWARPEFDDSGWKRIEVPVNLEGLGLKGGGIVWFRKSITLPQTAAQQDTELNALWLHHAATMYFNGVEIKDHSGAKKLWGEQLRFRIPKSLIHPGQPNLVAIRLHALTQDGGFDVHTRHMGFAVADPSLLDDRWAFHVEKAFPDLSPQARNSLPKPPAAKIEHTPDGLFNAMINPLIPYAIRGVIWYQGESNGGRHAQYRKLLTLLIQDWRSRWGEADFPFLIEQLANYNDPPKEPGEAVEAAVREAQLQVAQSVPHTGLAVAIDIGEVNIHPKNKQEVGRRLALVAMAKVYGRNMVGSGPIYQSMAVEKSQIRIRFTEVDGGLVAKDGPLKRFAIAGEDHKFVWAEARIEGETVVVSSPQVIKPLAVRYAWASNPEGANLYNAAGLPASPFRTDAPSGDGR